MIKFYFLFISEISFQENIPETVDKFIINTVVNYIIKTTKLGGHTDNNDIRYYNSSTWATSSCRQLTFLRSISPVSNIQQGVYIHCNSLHPFDVWSPYPSHTMDFFFDDPLGNLVIFHSCHMAHPLQPSKLDYLKQV